MNKIIVANWKMNGSLAFIQTFIPSLKPSLATTSNKVIICPPFQLLPSLKQALEGTNVSLGAQNCHASPHGAFTGEVSAPMLAELGCKAVIVGHSERRSSFCENDEIVKAKATAIHAAGMIAVLCIGESLPIRESGHAIDTVVQQCHASLPSSATSTNTFIAYEPIWAIGTGLTASQKEIMEMHNALHKTTNHPFPLLYGGSVTEQNVVDILSLPHVDGVLVGGASLKIEPFQKIIS